MSELLALTLSPWKASLRKDYAQVRLWADAATGEETHLIAAAVRSDASWVVFGSTKCSVGMTRKGFRTTQGAARIDADETLLALIQASSPPSIYPPMVEGKDVSAAIEILAAATSVKKSSVDPSSVLTPFRTEFPAPIRPWKGVKGRLGPWVWHPSVRSPLGELLSASAYTRCDSNGREVIEVRHAREALGLEVTLSDSEGPVVSWSAPIEVQGWESSWAYAMIDAMAYVDVMWGLRTEDPLEGVLGGRLRKMILDHNTARYQQVFQMLKDELKGELPKWELGRWLSGNSLDERKWLNPEAGGCWAIHVRGEGVLFSTEVWGPTLRGDCGHLATSGPLPSKEAARRWGDETLLKHLSSYTGPLRVSCQGVIDRLTSELYPPVPDKAVVAPEAASTPINGTLGEENMPPPMNDIRLTMVPGPWTDIIPPEMEHLRQELVGKKIRFWTCRGRPVGLAAWADKDGWSIQAPYGSSELDSYDGGDMPPEGGTPLDREEMSRACADACLEENNWASEITYGLGPWHEGERYWIDPSTQKLVTLAAGTDEESINLPWDYGGKYIDLEDFSDEEAENELDLELNTYINEWSASMSESKIETEKPGTGSLMLQGAEMGAASAAVEKVAKSFLARTGGDPNNEMAVHGAKLFITLTLKHMILPTMGDRIPAREFVERRTDMAIAGVSATAAYEAMKEIMDMFFPLIEMFSGDMGLMGLLGQPGASPVDDLIKQRQKTA